MCTRSRSGLTALALIAAAVSCGGCQQPNTPPGPDAQDAPGPGLDAGPPTPAPPPPVPVTEAGPAAPDAGPVSADCAAACAALTKASCPLGSAIDCGASMTRWDAAGKQANPKTQVPVHCVDVKKVATKQDAVNLGFTCQ